MIVSQEKGVLQKDQLLQQISAAQCSTALIPDCDKYVHPHLGHERAQAER